MVLSSVLYYIIVPKLQKFIDLNFYQGSLHVFPTVRVYESTVKVFM